MACSDESNIYINEILVDPWGGEVQLVEVSADLNSIMVNVKTPWGDTENYETIYKGSSKTYISGEKTYSVHMALAGYVSGKYVAKIYVCYEFVEKINTTISMIFDESASQLVEGEKLFFDILLKDQSDNILEHYDVSMYINNTFIIDVPGDWRYEHIVIADDIGEVLSFQTKFDGTEGFNPSQSSMINIEIPTPSTTGSLMCTSNPTNTEIWIDGVNSGHLTPKTFVDIEAANYTITFRKEGYIECSKFVTIIPDQQVEVFCELSTVLKCTQNIKIQNQNYNPVAGVSVEMDGITKTTDSNGLVSFVDIIRNIDYTISKSYGDYTGEDIITGCKLDPQILHIVAPEEPTCIDYITQAECEDNGCYWHSDNTCQSAPEGTTEYFDIHIKPYSWYEGKYEDALNSALALSTNLTGKIVNYLSSITGYEYTGLEIKEDVNKNIIIVRIFLKDTNETALVAPLVVAGLAVVVGSILIGIGYVIGTSQGGFNKSDITQLAEDIVRNAEIDAYKHAYNIDKTTATQLMDCLKTIETCDDSLTCFDNSGVTPSIANQLEVLVAYKTTIDAVYTGVADTVEDPEFEVFATEALANLEIVIQQLNTATITPEGAACETTDIIDDTIDDLDEKQGEQEDDDCVFDIFGNCVITEGALGTVLLIGAGIAAIAAYLAMKK